MLSGYPENDQQGRLGNGIDRSERTDPWNPLYGASLRVFLHFLGDRDHDWRLAERISDANRWQQRQGTHSPGALLDEFVANLECTLMLDVSTQTSTSVESGTVYGASQPWSYVTWEG